ncbi:MAG: hypothetical protein AAFV54_07450 [Pseudomonadota bacterium]
MPLRKTREFPLEPETRPPEPEEDLWLLEEKVSVRDMVDDYTSSFTGLGDQLGALRSLTSKVAALAPLDAVEPIPANAPSPVWADADLFDGEAAAPEAPRNVQWAADIDSALFDEDPLGDIAPVHTDTRVGLQLPIPEQHHPI